MRQIFSSQRVETAEGVATLLREAGIEVRLSNGRSYRSRHSGQFSYLDPVATQAQPTVWVVHANDQPHARELLRAAGLLDSTRRDTEQNRPYLSEFQSQAAPDNRKRWAWRIRLALLAAIGAVALVTALHHRNPPSPTFNAAPVQHAPDNDTVRVRLQPAPRGK
ncbi:pathogenicity-like protein [Xanthomonas albilineans]|uniref:pathogenicity-like protein n=1 Tax=Xanthomonas albilineans TaxID=29447 RepID=UPI0005F34D25|nr:pathogenicity-like protein [Xanthomonas albilineans]PPU93249.1 pathogenicity-like protein [Xanthomonas albilineans]